MSNRSTILVLLCLMSLPILPERSIAQTIKLDRSEWLNRLNAINPGDRNAALSEVNQLAGLPPGIVTPFVTGLWPDIKVTVVKVELLDAMFEAGNPDALRIARIAMADKSPDIAAAVKGVLTRKLGLDFGQDIDKVRSWVEAHKNLSYGEARANRVHEVIRQLRSVGKLAPSEGEWFLLQATWLFRDPDLHDTIMQSGLLDAARDMLRESGIAPELQVRILRIVAEFSPNETYLRETVLPLVHAPDKPVRCQALVALAKLRYPSAYGLLKAGLVDELPGNPPGYFEMAQEFANYRNPEAIPFLIGLIASDNNSTIYDVGYFALGQVLTGVPYSSTHDGNWWRIWWDANRSKLPAGVRDIPIPEFAHSHTYKEPVPREYHLDLELYRKALLEQFVAAVHRGDSPDSSMGIIQKMAEIGDTAAIPSLIGAIAADNSVEADYQYGYYGLGALTGVPYSILHDGTWWRLWWESHRKELPAGIRDKQIPESPRSKNYREPIPESVHRSPDAMRASLLDRLRHALAEPNTGEFSGLCMAAAELKDPRIVPEIIDIIPEDPHSIDNIYYLTYFGIRSMTGVKYAEGRGRGWWREWWKQNGTEFKKRFTDTPKLPDFITAAYKPDDRHLVPPVTEIGYNPQAVPAPTPTKSDSEADDIRDVRSDRYFANGDKDEVYRLVGLSKDTPAPAAGYKLLVVLPGGDGDEDFRWFISRVKKYALPTDVLIAELVAPKWSEWQANNLVWPTNMSPFFGMKFPTEQFIDNVIADASKRARIDPANICTFAWSSGGPAAYTHASTPKSHIRGAFVAMSVFRPAELPDPDVLKGRRFFIYHSPDDFIPIKQAKDAVAFLTAHGARVEMQEYQGGHGWTESVYKDIRRGVEWLFSNK